MLEENTVKVGRFSQNAQIQVRDEEGSYLFRKEWLQDYGIVKEPGKYVAQVTSDPFLYDPAEYGEDGNPRYIVNLKLVRVEDVPKVIEALTGKEFVKASEVQANFMTGNIWPNDLGEFTQSIPMKKELVEVNIDEVTSKSTGEVKLGVVGNVRVKEARKADKFNMQAAFAGENMPK